LWNPYFDPFANEEGKPPQDPIEHNDVEKSIDPVPEQDAQLQQKDIKDDQALSKIQLSILKSKNSTMIQCHIKMFNFSKIISKWKTTQPTQPKLKNSAI